MLENCRFFIIFIKKLYTKKKSWCLLPNLGETAYLFLRPCLNYRIDENRLKTHKIHSLLLYSLVWQRENCPGVFFFVSFEASKIKLLASANYACGRLYSYNIILDGWRSHEKHFSTRKPYEYDKKGEGGIHTYLHNPIWHVGDTFFTLRFVSTFQFFYLWSWQKFGYLFWLVEEAFKSEIWVFFLSF